MMDDKTLIWNSAILLHDSSISSDVLTHLKTVLSENIAIVSYDLGEDPSKVIKDLLMDIPARKLGNKFLVITKESSVSTIHKEVKLWYLELFFQKWFSISLKDFS